MVSSKAQSQACGPFLGLTASPTLRQETATAKVVLYGTVANPRYRGGPDSEEAITDLHILTVLKGSRAFEAGKVIELPRYIPVPDPSHPPAVLLFFDLVAGKPDPYRGVLVKSAAAVDYVKGATALDPKKSSEFLSYFFRHLEHPDPTIADDALLEFAKIDYRDVPRWARGLPADKLARWLEQPKLAAARVRLYAPLLGDCGSATHGALLCRLLDRARNAGEAQAIDGLLLGYAVLRPKEGWAYLKDILAKTNLPFQDRFGALRALRFLWGARPGLVSTDELVSGVLLLLGQPDIADLAVDDLRRWKRWDAADQVLGLYGKDSHACPVIRRAIIRYALHCPTRAAKAFVADRRKDDAELVKNLEDLMASEGDG
jgi:hypothetical protein